MPHKTKLLIIDKDENALRQAKNALSEYDFLVQTLTNPLPFINGTQTITPDVIILETVLEELNGFQMCRIIKSSPQFESIPVIFLAQDYNTETKIKAFEAGAQDYICKPFHPKELALRIKAIMTRSLNLDTPKKQNWLQSGNIVINLDTHTLLINDSTVELTATEFNLMWTLMKRKGRVQTREALLNNVWHYDTDLETRTVDTHITRLRNKLGTMDCTIETVRGVGYKFTEEPAKN